MPRSSANLCLAFSLLAATLLSGCGPFQQQPVSLGSGSTSSTGSPTAPATTPGSAIVGNVHGGQQAVVGAHIYLFAANPAGYGSPSISMLNSTQPDVETDATGNYILTDPNGNFSISGDYTCTAGQQVYLLALGGNPGLPPGETNPALALMSAHSYLINAGRAGLIRSASLRQALNNKSIAGAAFDVFTPEPLPPADRSWTRQTSSQRRTSPVRPATSAGAWAGTWWTNCSDIWPVKR